VKTKYPERGIFLFYTHLAASSGLITNVRFGLRAMNELLYSL